MLRSRPQIPSFPRGKEGGRQLSVSGVNATFPRDLDQPGYCIKLEGPKSEMKMRLRAGGEQEETACCARDAAFYMHARDPAFYMRETLLFLVCKMESHI